MKDLGRRQLLATATTTAAVAVAGCSDLLDGESGDDEPTEGNSSESDESDEPDEDDEPETPTEIATAFVEELGAERYEAAEDLNEPYVAGNLEQFWMGYTAVHGPFEEVLETEESDDVPAAVARQYPEATAIDLTVAFADGTDNVLVAVDDGTVVFADVNSEYERPAYVDPESFTERHVTVETEDCPLEGIVTLPTDATADSADVPGVVLVHGSGAADMDVSSYGSRMFADIAEGLASRGIAVLRYHKRTAVCPVEPDAHTLDRVTVDDALVAIEKLRGVDGVAADDIVVVGHSMGGMAVPRIIDRDGDLAGGVAMAAPARPMSELIVEQYEHFATVGDHDWPRVTEDYEEIKEDIEDVRTGDYSPGETILDYPGALWDSLQAYDHVERAQAVDAPLLFVQSRRDFQVDFERDFQRWQAELADRPATQFEAYDGLDHQFMSGSGPSVTNEYLVRNNVEEVVIDDLSAWIDARTDASARTAATARILGRIGAWAGSGPGANGGATDDGLETSVTGRLRDAPGVLGAVAGAGHPMTED